jgi:hypothetical protein
MGIIMIQQQWWLPKKHWATVNNYIVGVKPVIGGDICFGEDR